MLTPLRHYHAKDEDGVATFLIRRRVQLLGGFILAAFLPFLIRSVLQPETIGLPSSANALFGNALAVVLVFWLRLSVETYPGVRSSYVILPAALGAHALIVTALFVTRLPYDRLALATGFGAHVLWNYAVYFLIQRRQHLRIGVIPFGRVDKLYEIETVDWSVIKRPDMRSAVRFNALVADFAADLPNEWEAFLASAALKRVIVYQVDQLFESLTGRVEVRHLSENSFGSLVPVRAYAAIKHFADFMFAVLILPFAIPVLAITTLAIWLLDGRPIFYRQMRVGSAGEDFKVVKFRTMKSGKLDPESVEQATTRDGDPRITPIGAFLRRTRLDELPQIWNVLRGEMSWIGPRPEARALGKVYTAQIPFYRYRHVVKPGISGWAQVNQGHVAGVDEVHLKLQYDFFYVKYFSPWLDMLILLRTIKTVFTGFGSR